MQYNAIWQYPMVYLISTIIISPYDIHRYPSNPQEIHGLRRRSAHCPGASRFSPGSNRAHCEGSGHEQRWFPGSVIPERSGTERSIRSDLGILKHRPNKNGYALGVCWIFLGDIWGRYLKTLTWGMPSHSKVKYFLLQREWGENGIQWDEIRDISWDTPQTISWHISMHFLYHSIL